MLRFDKIKDYKIYIIIAGIVAILLKVFGMGKDKEKLNQYETNEKIIRKRKEVKLIDSFRALLNKLRKHKF